MASEPEIKHYTAGILFHTTRACPASRVIADSFQSELSSLIPERVTFVEVSGHGSMDRLEHELLILIDQGCDLLYATSVECAERAVVVLTRIQKAIPLIYAGMAAPLKVTGLLSISLTGIIGGGYDLERHMRLLRQIKPTLRSLLLIFDPSQHHGAVSEHAGRVQKELDALGVMVYQLRVSSDDDLLSLLPAYAAKVESCMILRDSTVLSQVSGIASWCDTHGITLCASESASVSDGVALGYGEALQAYGTKAAACAVNALTSSSHSSGLLHEQVLVHLSESELQHRLVVNEAACKRQGVSLHPLVRALVHTVPLESE